MMKRKSNLLLAEHLLSLNEIKQAETDAFFYTRLKARMERENTPADLSFPLKPIWIISAMVFLLVINVLMIGIKYKTTNLQTEETPSLKNFAASNDQSIFSF